MSGTDFFDTNVLVYSVSADADKAGRAEKLIVSGGVISVQERASYMGRVRDLARSSCEAYAEKMTPEWQAKYPEWAL